MEIIERKDYYPDGQLQTHWYTYDHKYWHGECICYYCNGEVWERGFYENDVEVRLWYEYDKENNKVKYDYYL